MKSEGIDCRFHCQSSRRHRLTRVQTIFPIWMASLFSYDAAIKKAPVFFPFLISSLFLSRKQNCRKPKTSFLPRNWLKGVNSKSQTRFGFPLSTPIIQLEHHFSSISKAESSGLSRATRDQQINAEEAIALWRAGF